MPSAALRVLLMLSICSAACGNSSGLPEDMSSGTDTPGMPGSNPICDQLVAIDELDRPELMLVVDRSGSMEFELAQSGGPKWPVLRDALSSTVQSTREVAFGLSMFPADDGCAPGGVDVELGGANLPAVDGVLVAAEPAGGTPTHTTLAAMAAYFDSTPPSSGGRFILLATDGEPNCGGTPFTPASSVPETLAELESLAASGIRTFVLGFDAAAGTDPQVLTLMAQAGGTGQYYPAESPAELKTAIDDITASVMLPPCDYRLDFEVGDPDELGVTIDGDPIARDPTNGWSYDPSTGVLTFRGQACETLQSGTADEVRFSLESCGTIPIE